MHPCHVIQGESIKVLSCVILSIISFNQHVMHCMSFAVSISSVCLVLVGLLFGFNIQVSDSLNLFLSSAGGFLSGLGAAIAAFFSYKASCQWKHQFNHSVLYENLNELELLLLEFTTSITAASNDDNLKVQTAYQAPTVLAGAVSQKYQVVYSKIEELIPSETQKVFAELDLNRLKESLTQPFIDYAIKKNALERYIEENANDLVVCAVDAILNEEVDKKMNEANLHHSKIQTICSSAISNLREVRQSL